MTIYAPSPDFHYATKNELYLICALCYCDCLREIYASLLSDTNCDRLSTDLKTIKLIRPSDMHDRLFNSDCASGDSEQSRHNCVIEYDQFACKTKPALRSTQHATPLRLYSTNYCTINIHAQAWESRMLFSFFISGKFGGYCTLYLDSDSSS